MDVKIFCGSHAYAMIRHDRGALDIRLEPGRSAHQSLREYAAEQEARAADILAKAKLAREAADILESCKA